MPNDRYEITPSKTGQQNSIYNQYVKAGGIASKSSGKSNMEITQQVPVSSYYLLHGKFNGKNVKK